MAAGAHTAMAAMSPRDTQCARVALYSTDPRTRCVGALLRRNAQPSASTAPALATK
jgi:hypothetical protein